MVSAWKRKRTSSPRARSASATASATRTSRRLPAWMLPEVLMPETTTCGPGPRLSATLFAHPGMGRPLLTRCSKVRRCEVRGTTKPRLARGLHVDDLVLRRSAGRGDGHLLPDAALEDGLPDRR